MSINSNDLREINNDLVRSVLKRMDSATKTDIAKMTGLSISTCRNILNDFIVTGEVHEANLADSTGGRPSKQFIYNKEFAFIGTLYFRNESKISTLSYCITNLLGEKVLTENRIEKGVNVGLIYNTVEEMLKRFPKITVIAIGIPGVIKEGSIDICDFPELTNVPLKSLLKKRFPISFVIENDVNAAALGYCNNNNVGESFAYLYYPEKGAPGAGIVINGKVLKGDSNFAGEISFLPLDVKRRDQGRLQENREAFFALITKTILAVNAIINPSCIVVSWVDFQEQDVGDNEIQQIQDNVDSKTIQGNSPEIKSNKDIGKDYIEGLIFLGLKENSYRLKVVDA